MQMFLSRMVSGFICSKNSNKNANNNNNIASNQQPPPAQSSQQQHQQQQHHACQQPPAKSPKSRKKSDKCKRLLAKTDSKKSLTELLKPPANAKETPAKEAAPSTSKATLKPPTKVKSGSWKRSEKQISSYNSISGKKSKSLRKRSPTWLKFPNSAVKITEKVSATDSTSACRPGTLYSDVLFGAGSSCLVKIKTLTPRRNNNAAQKKLTKALLKCAGNEKDASGSETETDRELFPSLNEYSKSPPTPEITTKAPEPTLDASVRSDDEADVVILSETNGMQMTENGFSNISYGSYLEQHFKHMNGNATTTVALEATITPQLAEKCPSGKPFTIDIPQWNFLDADVSSDAAYPKFLCQFEDEHYLKVEKMALLGLKLALGNNAQQAKFKF